MNWQDIVSKILTWILRPMMNLVGSLLVYLEDREIQNLMSQEDKSGGVTYDV